MTSRVSESNKEPGSQMERCAYKLYIEIYLKKWVNVVTGTLKLYKNLLCTKGLIKRLMKVIEKVMF